MTAKTEDPLVRVEKVRTTELRWVPVGEDDFVLEQRHVIHRFDLSGGYASTMEEVWEPIPIKWPANDAEASSA